MALEQTTWTENTKALAYIVKYVDKLAVFMLLLRERYENDFVIKTYHRHRNKEATMVSVKMCDGAVHTRVSISTVSNVLSESAASREIPSLPTASRCHLSGTVSPREERRTIAEISRYRDERVEGLLVCTSTPYQEEQFLCRLATLSSPVLAIWSQDVPETIRCAAIDHRVGASQAIQHLLGLSLHPSVELSPVFGTPHFRARSQGHYQPFLDG
jgi:hypothetical protein